LSEPLVQLLIGKIRVRDLIPHAATATGSVIFGFRSQTGLLNNTNPTADSVVIAKSRRRLIFGAELCRLPALVDENSNAFLGPTTPSGQRPRRPLPALHRENVM
jgi:hypothetical protein